jgi:hypothetical protein
MEWRESHHPYKKGYIKGKETNKRTARAHHAADESGARLLARVHRVLALGTLNIERIGRVRQQRLARRVGTSRLLKCVRVLLPVALGALNDHGAARKRQLCRAEAAINCAVLRGQAIHGRLIRWLVVRLVVLLLLMLLLRRHLQWQSLRLWLHRQLVMLLRMRCARVNVGSRLMMRWLLQLLLDALELNLLLHVL